MAQDMNTTREFNNILVIGMGNVLMQDEGIGVRAVEELDCRYEFPANVRLMDGGTTGMELFEPMRTADCLIIADAVNFDRPPGTLVRIADKEINAFFQTKISNHQLGLSDLLALLAMRGETPQRVAIIGMVPYGLENRLGLSTQAAAGLEPMVEMLLQELALIGVTAARRNAVRMGHWHHQAALEEQAECA
jgi:hydrogenase maturation protease